MSDTGREATGKEASSPQPTAEAPAAAATATSPEAPQGHPDEEPADTATETSPSFEPVFTLLTNASTNTTVHPRVHYLFSDDDPSILTSSAADANERALVVDLAPSADSGSGWAVSCASSLSPDFAVTESQLSLQQQSQGDCMLRLEGVEREPVSESAGGGGGAAQKDEGVVSTAEDVDGLVDDFKRRMGVLKKVVGEGERRRVMRREDTLQGNEVEDQTPDKERTEATGTPDGS